MQTHLWYFICDETKLLAYPPQQVDVAFTIVTEEKTSTQVNLFCLQTIDDDITQKILRANLREGPIEMDDDRLLDAEHTHRVNFLIERLQKRRG